MRNAARLICFASGVFILGISGCGPSTPGEVPPPPPITMTSPEQTIESFVANIRYEQALIAARQRAAAAQAADDGKRLLASDHLTEIAKRQVRDNPIYETIFGDDAVLSFRNNWASLMLYDLKTLNLNEMRMVLSPDSSRKVRYRIPSGGGIYTIELLNLGDRWGISMVTAEATKEIKPLEATQPASTSAAASAPSSRPATTP